MQALSSITVLVADDNDINRYFVARAIEPHVEEVSTASDGREAVRVALEKQPDLLILDIHMPAIDGLEALRRILMKGGARNYRPLSLALTADARKEEQQRLLAGGFDGYLSKPASIHHLTSAMKALVEFGALPEQQMINPVLNKGLESVLDDDLGLAVCNDDYGLLRELRRRFHIELTTAVSFLDGAIAENDIKAARGLIHQLQASAGYCGATAMVSAIKHFRTALVPPPERVNPEVLAEAYLQFIRELNHLRRVLPAVDETDLAFSSSGTSA